MASALALSSAGDRCPKLRDRFVNGPSFIQIDRVDIVRFVGG